MIAIAILSLGALLGAAPQEGPGDIKVGHWVEIRGELRDDGYFHAEKVEVLEPEKYETIIGTVEDESDGRFFLLGQPVTYDDDVSVGDGLRLGRLEGSRLKLEGRWRNAGKFSARKLKPRGPGRARIAGRADLVKRVGAGWEIDVMSFHVLVPDGVEFEAEKPLAQLQLSEVRGAPFDPSAAANQNFDEDDLFGEGLRITDNINATGQLEWRYDEERNFNLDDPDSEDRDNLFLAARNRFEWRLGSRLSGRLELRYETSFRDEQEDGYSKNREFGIGELWAYWRNAFGSTEFDLQVGRQDFDDQREWIYDENLDGVRLVWDQRDLRTEFAVSTQFGEAGEREDESINFSTYVSNNDEDNHMAAWAMYRDIDLVSQRDEESLHVGGRMVGEWLPDMNSWLDVAYQTGERDGRNIQAWAYDIGTTWSPEAADPFYFTLGYALASGDRSSSGRDGNFRQTGFQDNNGLWGGVTSFRYYGELVDPELSNMGIFTAGVGTRFWGRNSIDLVFHHFTQDVPLPVLTDAEIEDPTGLDADLGWEFDAILGMQRFDHWNIEIVYAWFQPGDAYVEEEEAQFLKFQLRYRF